MLLLTDGSFFKTLKDDDAKAFINYFDRDEYLSWFEGTKNLEFAKSLMDSQAFATFCDDFFDKDVSNMLIYLNINKNGFNFAAMDPALERQFKQRMEKVTQEVKTFHDSLQTIDSRQGKGSSP